MYHLRNVVHFRCCRPLWISHLLEIAELSPSISLVVLGINRWPSRNLNECFGAFRRILTVFLVLEWVYHHRWWTESWVYSWRYSLFSWSQWFTSPIHQRNASLDSIKKRWSTSFFNSLIRQSLGLLPTPLAASLCTWVKQIWCGSVCNTVSMAVWIPFPPSDTTPAITYPLAKIDFKSFSTWYPHSLLAIVAWTINGSPEIRYRSKTNDLPNHKPSMSRYALLEESGSGSNWSGGFVANRWSTYLSSVLALTPQVAVSESYVLPLKTYR